MINNPQPGSEATYGYLTYAAMVRNRLVPHLGKVKLQALGPGHIAGAMTPCDPKEPIGEVMAVAG
jgi:hypothetical protein